MLTVGVGNHLGYDLSDKTQFELGPEFDESNPYMKFERNRVLFV